MGAGPPLNLAAATAAKPVAGGDQEALTAPSSRAGSRIAPRTQSRRARDRTVVLLGHEHDGVPLEIWELVDEVVEIPMVGTGRSLNVAVAGSLVLYRLGGCSDGGHAGGDHDVEGTSRCPDGPQPTR